MVTVPLAVTAAAPGSLLVQVTAALSGLGRMEAVRVTLPPEVRVAWLWLRASL